jgi:hypothetical protein
LLFNHYRDWVKVAGVRFQSEPLGFERYRAAAGERV